MKAGVRVICRHETALGVALAGIAPLEASTGAEAAAAFATLDGLPQHGGIVLVERELFDALPLATRRRIRKQGAPVVMPFPGPAPLPPGITPEQDLLEVLRRAVGYRMRLR